MTLTYCSTLYRHHIVGELPNAISKRIVEYVKRSPLYNPYEEGNAILKWAVAVYRKEKATRGSKSRVLGDDDQTDDEPPEGSALSYNKAGGTRDFDHLIPKWDITLDQLQEMYDKARFERYLAWKKTYWFCFKKEFKRRIPWLYPENGKIVLFNFHTSTVT